MKKILKKIIKKLKLVYIWYKVVLTCKSDYHISLYTRILYAIRGFSVNEYIWYNLKQNNYKDYISDYARIKSREINGEYKIILDDKLLFEEIFRNYIRVPKTYAWISSGQIYGLHEFVVNNYNIIEFLKEKKISVLKFESGAEGKGTYIINYVGNNQFSVNGITNNISEIQTLFFTSGQAILCEYITQSKFSDSLYPYATNTIRIVCAKKKNERSVRIIKAVQRIGNQSSKPVDNVSQGGFASEINIETGRLGPAIAKYGKMERRLISYEKHPDTGNQISGRVIPNWRIIKKEIIELTNKFPYLNFVAWDVLLIPEGICIIEGNASSGCGMFQLHHGVKNEELGQLYKEYGIIK